MCIPELFADDEKLVSKSSALFVAATQLPIVIGPAFAGVLISWLDAPAVLVVDAATYLLASVCVAVLVVGGRRAEPDESARGVFAGIRYLARDRLLGPMTLTVIILDGAAGAIAVAVPLLAYTRYHRDPAVAGWIFTSFGVGAVIGSLVAMKLLDRIQPLKLASVAIVLATIPLWTIAADISWPLVCAAVAVFAIFVPMVNAPTMGILSTRPPLALRAKVMTAVMTASGLGSPVGRLVVGPAFRAWGNAGVWFVVAGGLSLRTVLWVAAGSRGSAGEAGGPVNQS